jgi:NAD(P)-dependent dehydrogenase (short-subunit alcohol dehydrogenase family)
MTQHDIEHQFESHLFRPANSQRDRLCGMSRAVLVTGASRGIGRATARAFAASGDRVAVHHRDSADLANGVLAELPGEGHVVVRGDVGDPAAVRDFVDAAAHALGGNLDVVVNNAAVFTRHPIDSDDYEGWQAAFRNTIDVNLIGPANVIWCAVRHMRPGGRIVNVSSRGAFRGEPEQPGYGASKAGLNALGQSLAVALAPRGITVTAVAPGFVETEMANEHLKAPRGAEIRAQSPFDRVARPDEIAAAIHWLASPEAEWASGTIVDLNGASYLRT